MESFTSVLGFTEESLSQPAAASSLFKGAFISTNKTPPEGHKGGLSAVTLPFSHLKLGGKVSGDSPPLPHANPLKNYYFRRGALHRLQK